MLPKTASQPD